MITVRARESLDRAIEAALRQNLVDWAPEGGELERLDDPRALKLPWLVMISITSYTLRVITFLHHADGPALRSQVARVTSSPVDDITADAVADQIRERANLIGGALNRDLVAHFHHLGMSTPNLLERTCLEHMPSLRPLHEAHFSVRHTAGLTLGFSAYVCSTAPLDLELTDSTASAAAGELELL